MCIRDSLMTKYLTRAKIDNFLTRLGYCDSDTDNSMALRISSFARTRKVERLLSRMRSSGDACSNKLLCSLEKLACIADGRTTVGTGSWCVLDWSFGSWICVDCALVSRGREHSFHPTHKIGPKFDLDRNNVCTKLFPSVNLFKLFLLELLHRRQMFKCPRLFPGFQSGWETETF